MLYSNLNATLHSGSVSLLSYNTLFRGFSQVVVCLVLPSKLHFLELLPAHQLFLGQGSLVLLKTNPYLATLVHQLVSTIL